MRPIRPDLTLLWPAYTLFPLVGLSILAIGVAVGDAVMSGIGVGLLGVNTLIVANHAYFTTLSIEGDELVYRRTFGLEVDRVPLGALRRIDAKRYPGAHSGVSAPYLVARGRDSTVKVNTKPYRLRDFVPLLEVVRRINGHVELDPFWAGVAAGDDVSKDATAVPRSRW
ncbi:MAG: hypothetical protein ACRDGE_11465 [Candidatus Limnocylindria bacterium]